MEGKYDRYQNHLDISGHLVAEYDGLLSSLRQALGKTGLELELLNEMDQIHGSGILYLEEIPDSIFNLVDTLSHEGAQHLLILLPRQFQSESHCIWQLLQAGASDVLIWRDELKIEELISRRFTRWQEVDQILNSDLVKSNLIGESRIWKKTVRQIIEAACYTQEPVLLVGKTGTGKELAARLIHTLDKRPDKKNLVTVDCTVLIASCQAVSCLDTSEGLLLVRSVPEMEHLLLLKADLYFWTRLENFHLFFKFNFYELFKSIPIVEWVVIYGGMSTFG